MIDLYEISKVKLKNISIKRLSKVVEIFTKKTGHLRAHWILISLFKTQHISQ